MRFARLRGNPPAKSVLTDIRSRCKWLPELEKLCLRAVDRLEALHDEVAQCREDDPPRVKYIDTVVILLDRIIRRKPLLTRLARFHSVTLIIRGLHQDLDEVETGLGTSIEGNEWRDQWERDRTEQFSILEQLVQNTTDRQLVREIKSEKVVEQVLMELHKELVECPLETHWQLMRATFDRVCAFARLNGIQYPDWYISADDLMFEEGPGVAGTFGEVRRATWFHGGERTCVIVKQLFQDSSLESDQDTFEQFERWKNLSGCDHILTFHGGSHASKPQFFVCEYAPYGNLRGFLTDEKNETMMWPLFLQAAEGLKALHSHGIVHGALKCSNILVDANYTAKLADFGFASARMHAMELNSVAATAIGSAVRWKPKEILEYSDMTGPQFQADTYSLGMCMIEALTHQAPFSMVGDDTEAVEMILHGESHPRPDGVSDAVWNLISQLSEPDSAKRPTLDMAIEMIRELIKMQAKEKESDIMASIAGMTAIKSTEEAGTVPGEMVKTEVFCSWEADGSIVTTTVRTTTCTRTSASGELITEVTNTETEVTTETTETTEETVEEVTEETMEGTQGTITTTETTEVTEVTTIETITEEADAGSEDGMESSAALVASDTAAMSSLYARYAHESSSMESMTLSVDIDAAAQEIHRVCTGATSNEAALASLLLSKTVEQRYLIWCRYRILYKQNLSDLVKSKSDYGVLLKMLASPLEHAEAEILRKATKGLGTTEEWIYPVVMGRSNADIALLKKTFQEKYSDDLGKILNGDLSGSLKKVIETAMRGEVVEFDASVHTSAQSSADADRLYKAGEGRWGTDKKTFINILVLSPAQHVRNINRAYMVKHKSGLIGAIKAEFSGDTKRALLFLVRSVLEPMDLLAELFETALKRAGKNAYGLSAWVVRYFHLLERIFIAYRRLYRQDLRIRIRSVVRGEYRQLLLSVFDAAGVELGVFTPRSGLAGPTMSGAASRGSVMPMTQGQSRTQRTCKDDHGKLSGFMLSFKQSWDSPEEEPTADSEHSVPSCVNGHHVGFESDVYWLGQCIVDVFCGQSMANNRVDTAMRCDGCNTNPLLHRPEELTDTEWQLIKDMCAAEPSSRIDMPDVVERLARLIAVDAVIDQLASSSSQYLDCSKRNRGQSNLLTVMSSYTTTSGQSNLLMSCYATGYDTNSDLDYDSFSDSLELSQETVKGGVLEVKFEELTQVDSFDRSAEDAVKERYRDDLETLLNAEEKGSSSSNGLLMASAQPRKLYGRLRCLPPDPISPQWILSTDHIAESTWRESDLGSGSFAAVCRGAWLGAPVALKKLKKFDLKSAQTLREEANIWFTLRHPNIVSLFGASTRGYPLFVCEYIDGQRLDECRKGEAKVSDEEIWGYLHDAAVGLQGLHMHGVVHADLKCDNILIGAEGRAKLIDFGLSCLQTCDGGAPLGAKQWKAPECLQGAGPTFESDIYGFGMCIIQAFAGKCPWGQIPDQAVAVHVANGRLPSKPATLTQLQWEAIRKMCRQDPQARLQLDFVVRVLGFFAGHLPYIDDATLQEEFSSWTSTTE
ncbi:hypothetical protein PC113_g11690 [Phytophthora cactorum]|uniref:Protein kinase domain-containing protein n=1 Tax=Phytophthora cactorum TaxID=29920 RepID=A0A8T0Z2J7_9STRA|nr:hypothetical protein PC113_g11690 [Phytophthora cactorum]